jgi:hypothetical protein
MEDLLALLDENDAFVAGRLVRSALRGKLEIAQWAPRVVGLWASSIFRIFLLLDGIHDVSETGSASFLR